MRKKHLFALLAAGSLLLSAGCGEGQPPQAEDTLYYHDDALIEEAALAASGQIYQVFFFHASDEPGPALVPEERVVPGEDVVRELIQELLTGPETNGLETLLPSSLTFRNWTLRNGLLTVDFSSAFSALSGVRLTLAEYCVALTLTPIHGVAAVRLTAGGAVLPQGQRLVPGNVWSDVAQTGGG